MKKMFTTIAFLVIAMFAFAPAANASMWNGTSVSTGAVMSTNGGASGSLMVGYDLPYNLTAQAYHNQSGTTGADVVYNLGPVIAGVGAIQYQPGVVGVVGYKLGNFKVLGHVYDGKNDGAKFGGNVGAYYTWNLK